MKRRMIPVVEQIMSANDQIAETNRAMLDAAQVFSINIMASPGAGKTSLIEETIEALRGDWSIGVIEGDLASSIDAERVEALGAQAVQINTGGNCHLEAGMIQNALDRLNLQDIDLLIVENVGNLICPSGWKLGTHLNVLIASVPEGDDKPYKYPAIYRGVDVLVLNKIDLLDYVPFNVPYFIRGVELLNEGLQTIKVSCATGIGISEWIDWLREARSAYLLPPALRETLR
jgi:hydrogenase nickel incorporation protein HypB